MNASQALLEQFEIGLGCFGFVVGRFVLLHGRNKRAVPVLEQVLADTLLRQHRALDNLIEH